MISRWAERSDATGTDVDVAHRSQRDRTLSAEDIDELTPRQRVTFESVQDSQIVEAIDSGGVATLSHSLVNQGFPGIAVESCLALEGILTFKWITADHDSYEVYAFTFSAMAVKSSRAVWRSSAISWARMSGAGKSAESSRLSSFSQKMSRFTLSRFIRSS